MKLIALTGKKRHGKDTCYQFIRDLLGNDRVLRFSFADALKRECANLLEISVEEIEADKGRFRGLLQWWGTEWRRGQKADYWVGQLHDELTIASAIKKGKVAVITDCRFPNEADMVRTMGGIVVRVVRPLFASDPPDLHPSETAMDGYPCDHTITAATLDELKKATTQFINETLRLSDGPNLDRFPRIPTLAATGNATA